jgi:hypothetical protein
MTILMSQVGRHESRDIGECVGMSGMRALGMSRERKDEEGRTDE